MPTAKPIDRAILEHDPTTCPACVVVGSWADTSDTIAWCEAHSNRGIAVFIDEHNRCCCGESTPKGRIAMRKKLGLNSFEFDRLRTQFTKLRRRRINWLMGQVVDIVRRPLHRDKATNERMELLIVEQKAFDAYREVIK